MSNQCQPASELLPLLAAAFPHTFFADPKQVRPLKLNIHHDLAALFQAQALPVELDRLQRLKRFLYWYTQRTAYLQALARGEGRIDLTGAVVDTDIPPPIRQQAHQAVERRRPRPAVRGASWSAGAAALLPTLAAAFPHTFFPEPAQVQPLKAFLYRDLLQLAKAGALPAGIDRLQLKAFLRWYGGRTSYLNALAHGRGRLDLTGTVVTTDIPAALRQRAREEVQRRRQQQAARTSAPPPDATPPSVPRAAFPTALPAATINLEELYAMAVAAKLEITLKFSILPNARSAGQGKMAFALKTPDGQFVTAEVSNKVWNKLVKAATDWPAWTAALSGTMGERTAQGFMLANPGLQVFERKPKAPAETAPAPAVADPAELASVPLTAATANPDPVSRKPVLSLKNRKATS